MSDWQRLQRRSKRAPIEEPPRTQPPVDEPPENEEPPVKEPPDRLPGEPAPSPVGDPPEERRPIHTRLQRGGIGFTPQPGQRGKGAGHPV